MWCLLATCPFHPLEIKFIMPGRGYEDRVSILQGGRDMIFNLVRDQATPEQWTEWLRAPLEHAAGTANHELVERLLKAGAKTGVRLAGLRWEDPACWS